MATIAVALAVLAGVTQLLGLVSQHRAAVQQRQVATRELGNVMERIMAIRWAELTTEKTSNLPVSAVCQAVLRDPKLQVSIVPESPSEDLVQIRLQLDWQNAAGQRARPVRACSLEVSPGGGYAMTARRRGFTLIECLTAFTLLASVLAAVSVTLHTLYQADHRLRDVLAQDRELERLAKDLRTDVHVATAVAVNTEAAASGSELALTCGQDRTVTYTLQPRQVDRMERQGDAVMRRESYRLPLVSTAWQVQPEGGLHVVTLQIDPPPADRDAGALRYRQQITAVAGMIRPFPASPALAGGTDERD